MKVTIAIDVISISDIERVGKVLKALHGVKNVVDAGTEPEDHGDSKADDAATIAARKRMLAAKKKAAAAKEAKKGKPATRKKAGAKKKTEEEDDLFGGEDDAEVSKDDIMTVVRAIVDADEEGGRAAVKAAFAEFGFAKLTSADPDQYPEILAAVQAIAEEG